MKGGAWQVVLNGVVLSGGDHLAFTGSGFGEGPFGEGPFGGPLFSEDDVLGCLTSPPDGMGLPEIRTEDVAYPQRDGVRHFADWYEPRIITLEDVSVCPDGCPGCPSAREKVQRILTAWSRHCDDTELVLFTDCHGQAPVLDSGGTPLARFVQAGASTSSAGPYVFPSSTEVGNTMIAIVTTSGGTVVSGLTDNGGNDWVRVHPTNNPSGTVTEVWSAQVGLPATQVSPVGGTMQGITLLEYAGLTGQSAGGAVHHNASGAAIPYLEQQTPSVDGPVLALAVAGAPATTDWSSAAPPGSVLPDDDDTWTQRVRVDNHANMVYEQVVAEQRQVDASIQTAANIQSDTGVVFFTSAVTPPTTDRSSVGPYGVRGRPRVAEVTWLGGGSHCASLTLRFDAVDHRLYVLDDNGIPGSGGQCVLLTPAISELCRGYDRCYEDTGMCYSSQSGDPGDGPVTVEVLGSLNVRPVITLRGPLSDPVVENTTSGERVSYGANIPDGAVVVIDTETGTARQEPGGASRTHLLGGNPRMRLRPGLNTLRLSAYGSGDTGTAEVCWRPAVAAG